MIVVTRVPATYKIEQRNKKRVDLLSTALGIDKSALIDEAIQLLAERRKRELANYLADAGGDFADRDIRAAERYLGRKRPNVAGGRVRTAH